MRGGTIALFAAGSPFPIRVRCGATAGCGAGLGAGAGGAILKAATKTGGNGTADVTPTAAMDAVSRPATAQRRVVPIFDSVRRRMRESRMEMSRVSSCVGCAIDTAANDKERDERRP